MMKLIIAAMIEEISELIDTLNLTTISKFPFLTVYKYNNILIVITGIGQTNAVVGLTTIINNFDIKIIYNFGLVGALKEKFAILEPVIVKQAYYTNVDVSKYGYDYGQVPKEKPYFETNDHLFKQITSKFNHFKTVNIGSADIFISNEKQLKTIQQQFNDKIDVVDMEAAGLYHCAWKYNIPIIAIKVISDHILTKKRSELEFNDNLKLASTQIKIIYDILTE